KEACRYGRLRRDERRDGRGTPVAPLEVAGHRRWLRDPIGGANEELAVPGRWECRCIERSPDGAPGPKRQRAGLRREAPARAARAGIGCAPGERDRPGPRGGAIEAEAVVVGGVEGTLELRLPLREYEARAGSTAAATEGARDADHRRRHSPEDERGGRFDDPLADGPAVAGVLRDVDRWWAGSGRRDESEPPSERHHRRHG